MNVRETDFLRSDISPGSRAARNRARQHSPLSQLNPVHEGRQRRCDFAAERAVVSVALGATIVVCGLCARLMIHALASVGQGFASRDYSTSAAGFAALVAKAVGLGLVEWIIHLI